MRKNLQQFIGTRRALQALAVSSALLLISSCGAKDDSSTRKVTFSKVVSFGTSLSDVGSYIGGAGALATGTQVAAGQLTVAQAATVVSNKSVGKFTINSASAKIWVEYLADQVGVAAPCAAEIGWANNSDPSSFAAFGSALSTTIVTQVTATNQLVAGILATAQIPSGANANCFAYGQGGSLITSSQGKGHKANAVIDANTAIAKAGTDPTAIATAAVTAVLADGALTVPLVTQISNHKTKSSTYAGNELVLFEGGANDVSLQIEAVSGQKTTPTAAGGVVVQAATELALQVKSVIDNGAKYVVVINLPSFADTPRIASLKSAAATGLADSLVQAFNNKLKEQLAAQAPTALLVDVYTLSKAQIANPAQFGLSNSADMACQVPTPTAPSSLLCGATGTTLANSSKYFFADDIHPTPEGHRLLAQAVAIEMAKKGWL